MRLGLDFGGVIVPVLSTTGPDDTVFGPGRQAPIAGAVESVRELVDLTGGQVWIISKARERMEHRTREWLQESGFHSTTGLRASHVRFCRERVHKKPICEELAITHFVDDRVHTMQILQGTVEHLYRFAPENDRRFTPGFATHVSSWAELMSRIRAQDEVGK